MQIDTLRPTGNVSAGANWTREEDCSIGLPDASAFWEVLSDNDDDTYAVGENVGSVLVVSCGNHTPPANHQRHAIRCRGRFLGRFISGSVRVRALQGTSTVVSELATTVPVGNCVVTERIAGYAATGLTGGGTVEYRYSVEKTVAQADILLAEAFIDIDNRAQPAFTADVLDGAGVSRAGGIVTDTSAPTLRWDSPTYDGLAPRTWRYAVYTLAQTLAGGFDPFVTTPVTEDSGTGSTSDQVTVPLADDDYVAYLQISSTIRVDSQYDSDIETVAFEIAFIPPDAPDVTTTVTPNPPSVEVCWEPTSPAVGPAWDDADDVVAEVQRSDCGGEFVTVHVAQTGVSGCWDDRFMPLSNEGVFCDEHQDCAVTYRVRYWGLVDSILVATDWTTEAPLEVDNPTPAFPWLRGPVSGDLSICPTESWGRTRPFGAFQQVSGGIPTVITGAPGGRDYTLVIPTTTLAELATLEAILAAPLVFYQPPMQADVWLAPVTESINVTKVKRIHEVTVPFVAVLAEPLPTPQSFF